MTAPSCRRLAVLLVASPVLCASVRAQAPPPPPPPPPPAVAAPPTAPKDVPLIPRALFFGLPDRADAGISPDGTHISFLAPVKGVLNIWTAPLGKMDEARPITKLTNGGIGNYFWTFNPKYMVFFQDQDGDENDHIFRVEVATGEVKDLTPLPEVKALLIGTSIKHPDEILIGLNDRNVRYHDVYKLNIATGESQRILKNNKYLEVLADDDLKLRVGITVDGPEGLSEEPDGHIRGRRLPEGVRPSLGSIVDPGVPAFDGTGKYVYLVTRKMREKASLLRVEFRNGESKVIADGISSDIQGVMLSPVSKDVQAVWEYKEQQQWQIVDPAVYDDFALIRKKLAGGFYIVDRTTDDRYWIVAHEWDVTPVSYYILDRKEKSLSLLFASRPGLTGKALAHMIAQTVPARDGLQMVSYLTLPPGSDPDENGRPDRPLPLVLWVHGGPTSRDTWGYDSVHQWLANRGYAVLSVNYRGSTGFGKKYEEASMRDWGGKMQADLDDAADWAVKEGIADPKRIAITGASYGGYAALCGLAFTPERYACAVDICGPSNLVTLIKKNQAPYFMVDMDEIKEEIGDPDSKRGREFLLSRSPLTRAGDVRRPLLIGQGSNDPRVGKAESDQFVEALSGRAVPLTYIVYPDEGHGFGKVENDLSFYSAMEAFLAKHLGGRAEPIGNDLKDSSLQVVKGAGEIPGLPEALKASTNN